MNITPLDVDQFTRGPKKCWVVCVYTYNKEMFSIPLSDTKENRINVIFCKLSRYLAITHRGRMAHVLSTSHGAVQTLYISRRIFFLSTIKEKIVALCFQSLILLAQQIILTQCFTRKTLLNLQQKRLNEHKQQQTVYEKIRRQIQFCLESVVRFS